MMMRLSLLAAVLALTSGCLTSQGTGPGAASHGAGDPEITAARVDGEAQRPDGRLERIMRRADAGDLTRAERELSEEVRRQPARDDYWTHLGILQERLGQPGRARDSYRKALEKNPGQVAANLNLVRLAAREDALPAAEKELLERLERHPEAHGARLGLAQLRIIQGRTGEAAEEAKKVLKVEERNTRAMQLLAAAWFAEEKIELTQMVLENAIAIDPEDGALHNALGMVHLALEQKPQALASFAKAGELQPGLAEARNNHGAMLVEAQDHAAAEVELKAALASAPDFVAAQLNLGNALRGQGRIEEARAAYERALKLDPELDEAWFNLGILYLDSPVPSVEDLARYQQSLTWFETYAQKGGRDEALADYTKDAKRAIDREERRIEREKRTALRKAEEERKQQEAAREAARVAAESAEKEAEAARIAAETAQKDEGADSGGESATLPPSGETP